MSVVLSEHLPMLASAPDGIQKLRGLILELAVRGKLVPQDPNEEPELTSLAGVGKWAVGSGFPTAEQGTSGAEILFAKVSDMNLPDNGRFIVTTNNTISRETAARLRVNVHPAGTVVFPKIGGAIATNKRRILVRDTAIDNNCLGLTPKPGVLSNWLFVLLSAIDFTEYQAGTSVPALAQGVLAEIPVRLPSVAEQNQIVAKVDELMALCDRLETEQADAASAHARLVETLLGTLTQSTDAADLAANWQRLAEHFDTLFATEASISALKQTVLQLAVMGRLVPQDPDDEPASELLSRIAQEKVRLEKEGVCKKSKPLPPVEEDERFFVAPGGWAWCRLQSAFDVRDGTHDSPKFLPRGVPFLTSKNIYGGQLNLDDLKFISESDHIEFSKRSKVDRDDILFAMIGSIGNPVVVDTDLEFSFKNMALFKYFSRELASPQYLKIFLSVISAEMKAKAAGGVQSFVALGTIRNQPIALPPLAEQHRIVAKVCELMALCDHLMADIASGSLLQARLADTLIESALDAA